MAYSSNSRPSTSALWLCRSAAQLQNCSLSNVNNKLMLASLPTKPAPSRDPLSSIPRYSVCPGDGQHPRATSCPCPAVQSSRRAGWRLPGGKRGAEFASLPQGGHPVGSRSCLTTHFHKTYRNLASLKPLSRPNLIKSAQKKKSRVAERTGRWETADTMHASKAHSLRNCKEAIPWFEAGAGRVAE